MLNDINKIIFNFEDGNILDIPGKYFSKMYISNIDKVGDEIPYEETILKNKLYANFVLFKFNNYFNLENFNLIKDNNILSTTLVFNNNSEINFVNATDINPFITSEHNHYQTEYILKDEYAIVISEYKIKNLISVLL